ncbi:MAG: ferrochelatase [Candidatus Dormibacteraeota bacterium]|nr:ferrochelatase [Candidatus Dormibacteraeota bacterium]
MTPTHGVVLMTFGSAQTADEVPAYLRSVRHGGEPDPDLVAEFQRRYRLVGWSPLVRITQDQAAGVERLLAERHGDAVYRVRAGMLHSAPAIDEAIQELARAGAQDYVGVVLAPQYSPVIMGGYDRTLEAAVARHAAGARWTVAAPWHRIPAFLDDLSDRVAEALAALTDRESTEVLFTTHSLPKAVLDRDPAYMDQIRETIDRVVERAGLRPGQWQFAYQSAGHTPEPWLTPDLKDLLPSIRDRGRTAILVVPVQFLADHLEILYDLDVAAREEAEEAGLTYNRVPLPNTRPRFLAALADVVERERTASGTR